RMDASTLDMVLGEGFKHDTIDKIRLVHEGCAHSPEELVMDVYVIAVASDVPLAVDVPLLDINNIQQVADFVTQWARR
ncbi:molybdopterin-guanine dinucleotide biosynthesis protein B, partial [Citrobacter freundii]